MKRAMYEVGFEYKPRVLVIQPRRNPQKVESEQRVFQALAGQAGVDLIFVNPLTDDALPWQSPRRMLRRIDGVLHTGSSDIDLTVETETRTKYLENASALVREVIKRGTRRRDPIPAFGICLGHQAFHEAAGGKVERDLTQAETGTGDITLNERGLRERYLQEVPRCSDETGVSLFFGHKDSVVQPAPGFDVLGSTERNGYSITRNGAVFTTQAHPEITDAKGLEIAIGGAVPDPVKMGKYEKTYDFVNTEGSDRMIVSFFEDVALRGRKREVKREARRERYRRWKVS